MPTAGFRPVERRVTAYVIFQEGGELSWWDAFTQPGFRHCWLVLPSFYPEESLLAREFASKIECLKWGIDMAVWFADCATVVDHFLKTGQITVAVAVDITIPAHPGRIPQRGFITCVSIVKAALGLRAWKVWTPKQLCAYLLADCGGRVVALHRSGDSDEINRGDIRGREVSAAGA